MCCIKAPGFGTGRKNQLEDLGLITKSEVLDTELGMSFENTDVKIMGGAKKVIISKDETVFINGNGDKHLI